MKKLSRFFGTFVWCGLVWSGAAYATPPIDAGRILRCHFTEPFYELQLDLDSGKLVRLEYPNGKEPVESVVQGETTVSVQAVHGGVRILSQNISNKKIILDSILNYQGSNGMSSELFPFHVTHYGTTGSRAQGGCDIGGLEAYEPSSLSRVELRFARHGTSAIRQCLNRAVAPWTLDPSESQPGWTKFYAIYQAEKIPGEPGNVSRSLSEEERAILRNALLNAQIPPEDGATLYETRDAMWSYCLLYGELLQRRWFR